MASIENSFINYGYQSSKMKTVENGASTFHTNWRRQSRLSILPRICCRRSRCCCNEVYRSLSWLAACCNSSTCIMWQEVGMLCNHGNLHEVYTHRSTSQSWSESYYILTNESTCGNWFLSTFLRYHWHTVAMRLSTTRWLSAASSSSAESVALTRSKRSRGMREVALSSWLRLVRVSWGEGKRNE